MDARYKMVCNLESICTGFQISEEIARRIYSDARSLSKLSEHWAARHFQLKELGKDSVGSDLESPTGERHSVKCLSNRGTNVASSKFQGAERFGTIDDIKEDLLLNDYVIIVDIRKFPDIYFTKLDAKYVVSLIESGEWTDRKINPKRGGKKTCACQVSRISPERWDHLFPDEIFNVTLIS